MLQERECDSMRKMELTPFNLILQCTWKGVICFPNHTLFNLEQLFELISLNECINYQDIV